MVHVEVKRGLSQSVCMWDGQTESDYSTGKHPLAAVLTETRHMTHKSHIRVVSMSWKTLPLCLSSYKNISLFHICRVCRYWIHNAGKVSGKLLRLQNTKICRIHNSFQYMEWNIWSCFINNILPFKILCRVIIILNFFLFSFFFCVKIICHPFVLFF